VVERQHAVQKRRGAARRRTDLLAWFGPAAQQGLPAHGFARNLAWTLKAHNEDDNGVVLTFELHSSEASRQYWPHEFTLFARYKLGKTCEIELEAHGDFETTSALHTYFNVGDIHAVKVSGLGDRFIDKVNNAQEDALTDGVQTFPDRTDRVYLNPEACSVIHDSALNRTIEVIHHHHKNVVAWNPGPALSASMTDMPDDGYKTFVCVESACATAPQKPPKKNRLVWHRRFASSNANAAVPLSDKGEGHFS
jgi:glucose-6-phosphate 1-epimerase